MTAAAPGLTARAATTAGQRVDDDGATAAAHARRTNMYSYGTKNERKKPKRVTAGAGHGTNDNARRQQRR